MSYNRIKVEANRIDWLDQRRKGIGGSDCANILGMGYSSPLSVFLDKTGRMDETPDNLAMILGRKLEQAVADLFEEETGKKTKHTNYMFQSKEHPFMLANLDRLIVGEKAFLECKTTTEWNRTKIAFRGEIPSHWYCQVMHYMAVTGFEYCYLAVLIGNKDFRVFKIDRDEEDIQALIEAESDFWKMVEAGEYTGSYIGTEDEREGLVRSFRDPEDKGLVFDSDELEKRYSEAENAYNEAKKSFEEEKEKLEALKSEIKMIMGDEGTELKSGRALFTWKPKTTMRVNTSLIKKNYPEIAEACTTTTTTRDFRVKFLRED